MPTDSLPPTLTPPVPTPPALALPEDPAPPADLTPLADPAPAGEAPDFVPLPETVAVAAFGQSLTLAAPQDAFLRDDTLWRLREIYEPALATQTLAAEGVALDIGAGFGGFALPFACAFPGWTVWCFEPEPVAFARLKINIDTLGLRNVLALNVAVGGAQGAAPVPDALAAVQEALGAVAQTPQAPGAMAALLALCPAQDYRRHLDLRGVIERGAPASGLFEPCRFPTLPAAALAGLAPRLLKLTAPHAETAILEDLAQAPLDHVLGELWTQVPSRLVHGTTRGLRQTWLPVAGVPLLKLRRSADLTGHRPGLDVVVAMYNARDWIVDCVEGILAGPSDEVRVLVVDDGSTDGGGDLVAAGYDGHPRVALHRKANGGCASARNYGRLMSDAGHIAFVDADDVPGPGLYSGLLDLARYTGAEVVQGGFETLHDDTGGLRHDPSYEAQDPEFLAARRHAFGGGTCCTLPAALLSIGQPTIWRRVYRRDYLDNRKIWFPEHIRAFDDQIFQLLTLQPLRHVPMLDHVHYGYRQHPGQDIKQGDERSFYSLEMYRLMLKRALSEGWNDTGPLLRSYVNTVNWCWSGLRPDLRPVFVKAAAELWVWMQKALGPAAFRDLPDSEIHLPDFGHYTGRLHRLLHDIGPSHGWAYLDAIDMHVPMLRAARK
ncbi:FkbM family methyltransferase [Paracoccaceae bacterium Fryx2]|nr:FkbM family methyltransferase [Paracoccaceae bacterium Fryx2]